MAKIFCQFDAVNDPTGLSVHSKRRCLNFLRDVSLFSLGGGPLFWEGEGHNFFPSCPGEGHNFFKVF